MVGFVCLNTFIEVVNELNNLYSINSSFVVTNKLLL